MTVKDFWLSLLLIAIFGVSQAGIDGVTIQPNMPTVDDEIIALVSLSEISVIGLDIAAEVETEVTLNGNSISLVFEYTSCASVNCGSPLPPGITELNLSAGQFSEGDYDLTVSLFNELGFVAEFNPINFTVTRGSGAQSVPTLSLFSTFLLVIMFLIVFRLKLINKLNLN